MKTQLKRDKENRIIVGNWRIEHPTIINGKPSEKMAFVTSPRVSSGYVVLYGGGEIGVSSGIINPPEKVRAVLRGLSSEATT